MVAVLVLAEAVTAINRLVDALRSTPIYVENAFSRQLSVWAAPRLGNCAESAVSQDGWSIGGRMSKATPMPVEPPGPSAERLAAWQALIQRIRQGDRAEVLAWDEGAAAGPGNTYQVLVTQQARQRLRGTAPAGRLGRRDHRGPAGGSDRGQHDLSSAPAW